MATLSGATPGTLSLWDSVQQRYPNAILTSGYRSPGYNQYIGGARNSAHTHGNAIDFVVPGMTSEQLSADIASNFEYGKLITYPGQRNVHLEPGSSGTNLLKSGGGYVLNTALGKGKDILQKGMDTIVDGLTGKNAAKVLQDKKVRAGLAVATGGTSEAVYQAADFFGIGDDGCGKLDFICKLRKWLEDKQFFTRFAMVILGIILFLMAFYLLGTGQVQRVISSTVKG